MSDKFLCVLAGYDSNIENEINKITEKLLQNGFVGNQTKGLPNHITVGYFPVEKENDLVVQLNDISCKLEKIRVSFNHIGIFGGSKVLFTAPDPTKELITLKEKFEESINWTPHSTLLIDEPENTIKALPIVMNEFKPMQGYIEYLHLYEFMPARHILSVQLR
jgi:2'-5' RNA ligase